MNSQKQTSSALRKKIDGFQTLTGGLQILQLVASGIEKPVDIAKSIGITRSVALKMLSGLVKLGFVSRAPRGNYQLGPSARKLIETVWHQETLLSVSKPYLTSLVQLTHGTVFLGIPDGAEVRYICSLNDSSSGAEPCYKVGQRMPMAFTSPGKVLLTRLPEDLWESYYVHSCALQAIHSERVPPRSWPSVHSDLIEAAEKGFSLDLEESEFGIRSIAAPIVDVSGHIIASIGIVGTTHFMSFEHIKNLTPIARNIAEAISRDLEKKALHRMLQIG